MFPSTSTQVSGWSDLTETSLLTTFNTHWGKFRWLWLLFGVSVSSDIFLERLGAVIKRAPGIKGIADNF